MALPAASGDEKRAICSVPLADLPKGQLRPMLLQGRCKEPTLDAIGSHLKIHGFQSTPALRLASREMGGDFRCFPSAQRRLAQQAQDTVRG